MPPAQLGCRLPIALPPSTRGAPWLLALVLLALMPASGQALQIKDISPSNSAANYKTAGPGSGGRVNGLARSAAPPYVYYAASELGGLFASKYWLKMTIWWYHLPGHLPVMTWDVEADPSKPGHLYATSFYDGRVNSLAGINVSTDYGVTWKKPATATPKQGFCKEESRRDEPSAFGIALDPFNPKNVYIGTNCGLAMSADQGATWTFVDPTPEDGAADVWDVIVHNGGVIDVCGSDGHLRFVDGTWMKSKGPGLAAGRCSLAVSPDEHYVLFATVGTEVFESDNAGATWVKLTNPHKQGRIPFVATNKRTGPIAAQLKKFDLWFGDVELHRVICTTPAIPAYGGSPRCPADAWLGPFTEGAHTDAGDLLFAPSPAGDACPVLYSNDGGVYHNTHTASPNCHAPVWSQPNGTPHALWLYALDGAPRWGATDEDLYFGTQDNGTWATKDAGALQPSWQHAWGGDGFKVSAEDLRFVFLNCCYINTPRKNRLFVAKPGMIDITEISTYPPGPIPAFSPGVIARFGPDKYVLVTTDGVYVTQAIDANPVVWTMIGSQSTQPPKDKWVSVDRVWAAVSGGVPTFYVGVTVWVWPPKDGGVFYPQVWRYTGTAPGGTWMEVKPPGNTGYFWNFNVDPNNPNRLIALHVQSGAPQGMVMSTDGGVAWQKLPQLDNLMTGGGVFKYRNVRGWVDSERMFSGYSQPTLLAFDPEDSRIIVAGAADAGLFVSTDFGKSWKLVTDPLHPKDSGVPHLPRPNSAYFDHTVPSSPLYDRVDVYVGTKGRGAWRIPVYIPTFVAANCPNMPFCSQAKLEPGLITLDCLTRPCIFTDPVPDNCIYKYPCGPADASGNPPFYHMFLDDFDTEIWDVGLYTMRGEPAPFELFKTETGVVLSFQPSRELYRPGRIGEYQLAFALRRGARPDSGRIRTRLEVSDRHYQPPRKLTDWEMVLKEASGQEPGRVP